MENGVVYMQDLEWISKFGSVPVVVSGENGGLGFRVDTKDEGFNRLIGGKYWNRDIKEKGKEEKGKGNGEKFSHVKSSRE